MSGKSSNNNCAAAVCAAGVIEEPSPVSKPTASSVGELLNVLKSIDLDSGRAVALPAIGRLVQQFTSSSCLVIFINETDGERVTVYALEDSPGCPIRAQMQLSRSEFTLTSPKTEPLWANVDAEQRLATLKTFLAASDVKSLYHVPLAIAGGVLGALGFGCRSNPNNSELSLLRDMAAAAAILIDRLLRTEENHYHRTELERRTDGFRLSVEINALLAATRDLQQIVSGCSKSLKRVMGHDYTELTVLDATQRRLLVAAFEIQGSPTRNLEAFTYPIGIGPAGQAFSTQKSVFLDYPDLQRCPLKIAERWLAEELKAMWFVPLIVPTGVIGTLNVGWLNETRYSREVRDLLGQVCAQLAPAVENYLVAQGVDNRAALSPDELSKGDVADRIVCKSSIFQHTIDMLPRIASSDSSVLIQGETGTGKELVARMIHSLSTRKENPLIKVNCGAIPTTLFESELFGYERGAFTGAINRKPGRVELAQGGTLFLDEIGDTPTEIQCKMLSLIEDKQFERLGGTKSIRTDARIIAATNRDLRRMVDQREFRADLYYRLNVIPIYLPPLRERREDIPHLVTHFTRKHAAAMGKIIDTIPEQIMDMLMRRDWAGNVRELEKFVEWAVVMSTDRILAVPRAACLVSNTGALVPQAAPLSPEVLRETERERVRQALHEANGVIGGPSGAAAKLGLKRSTLQYRMRKLGIA
ncbi:MAG TPA: sigma 54-interacting transcriptional regulator [Terriglobia bacterium]|nr:sigma 54-interacting transcriptional regulator [Terriglobia bacterium]